MSGWEIVALVGMIGLVFVNYLSMYFYVQRDSECRALRKENAELEEKVEALSSNAPSKNKRSF